MTQYQDARALDVLAAAHAELGNFLEAVRFVQDAYRLAEARHDDALVSILQQHRQLYQRSQLLRSGVDHSSRRRAIKGGRTPQDEWISGSESAQANRCDATS